MPKLAKSGLFSVLFHVALIAAGLFVLHHYSVFSPKHSIQVVVLNGSPKDVARPTRAPKPAGLKGAPDISLAAPAAESGATASISSDAELSSLLAKIQPEYPTLSRVRGEEGEVFLWIEIGSDGGVIQVQVEKSSGFPRLDQAALQAVRLAQFNLVNKPNSLIQKRFTIQFRLNSST
jgi:TonB family protein